MLESFRRASIIFFLIETKEVTQTLSWLGGVNYENLEKTLSGMRSLLEDDPDQEITLLVNSYGGPTGIGLNFYDMIRSVLKPSLTTIGSGDVDSSGIIVFLAGEKRFLTKNTTLLFHLAGRTFEPGTRYSTLDLENILKEDKLKDYQYACVVADNSSRLTPEDVLEMMRKETVITSEEAVALGLAHKVLA